MNTDENIRCNICPFTCKGAEVCEPRQLKNKLQQFLPDVLEKTEGTEAILTKPNIVICVQICDKEYYV